MNIDEEFDTLSDRTLIVGLLREAIQHLATPGGDDGSAAWRVADAGLLLRQLFEADNERDPIIGVDLMTERGAALPSTAETQIHLGVPPWQK